MDLHPRQFVRVNVGSIKAEEEECERIVDRNFSVDPRTITLDRLRHLVARALDVRGEFSLVWRKSGCPLTCDWDLEALLSEEPRIELTLQVQPKEPGLEEWDIICPADVPVAGHEASPAAPRPRKGSFLEQLLHLYQPPQQCSVGRPPLTRAEFRSLADWPRPLRYAVYRAGGAEPGVRPALWMHLLDVYPAGADRAEREDFLNRKSEEYYGLRHGWQRLVRTGGVPPAMRDVTCLVRKDVRRTDRAELPDSDQRALYNVLTTYALNHPSVGYRQGMSDLLSPLLHVMRTEARAYVALCGLMLRMRDNFCSWRSLRTKFRHLRRLLRSHDPALHRHLRAVGAIDLLFCYRWLLLDLKREFPYHEMLTLTEVVWATLRPVHRERGVQLYETTRFPAATDHPRTDETLLREDEEDAQSKKRTAAKRRATARRQSSATLDVGTEEDTSSSDDRPEDGDFRHRRRRRRSRNDSSGSRPERSRSLDHHPVTFRNDATCHSRSLDHTSELRPYGCRQPPRASGDTRPTVGQQPCRPHPSDDRPPRISPRRITKHQPSPEDDNLDVPRRTCAASVDVISDAIREDWSPDDHRRRHGSSDSNYGSTVSDFDDGTTSSRGGGGHQSSSSSSEGYDSHRTLTERESSSEDDDDVRRFPFDDSVPLSSSSWGGGGRGAGRRSPLLPPPTRLGDGKPFLLFLCLVMLQGERDAVLGRRMDASEIGIHFDRMARAHRLADVLPGAREMFEEYLRSGWTEDD